MDEPPLAQRFALTRDRYGLRLAWVFGNQASGGVCPYRTAQLCHHCDIGDGEGREFSTAMNRNRLRWFLQHDRDLLPQLSHLVIYNSGSVLNPRELSPDVVLGICGASSEGMPRLQALSLDTREAFLREEPLLKLAGSLPERACVRPILGLESADDAVRDGWLEKRMPRRAIGRGLDALAAASAACSHGRVGLDANVLVGPPGVPESRVVADAVETAQWLLRECGQRSLLLDLNLHPYYPSRRGLARFPHHPRCSWQKLRRSVAAITQLDEFQRRRPGMFVGWQDEQHDQQPQRRQDELRRTLAKIERFNQSQDPADLS